MTDLLTSIARMETARGAAQSLIGVCNQCGVRKARPRARWLDARLRNTWLECAACGGQLYPEKRTCEACGAVLRNGNLTKRCAACDARMTALPKEIIP